MSGFAYLIVDDKDVKASMLQERIIETDSNAIIERVKTVNGAKRKLRTAWYDVMLLDLVLPILDGDEPESGTGLTLLEDIEQYDGFNLPPHVIAISEFGDEIATYREKFEDRFLGILQFEEESLEWAKILKSRLKYLLRSTSSGQQSVADGFQSDVAIVCALRRPELEQFLNWGLDWEDQVPFNDTTRYWRTNVPTDAAPIRVVACHIGDMGSTASALVCSKVCKNFRPRVLILAGICAGLEGTSIGDIIIGDPVWNFMAGKLCSNDGYLRLRAEPKQFRIDPRLVPVIERIEDSGCLRDIYDSWTDEKPPKAPKVSVAPMVSGSFVVSDDTGKIRDLVLEQNRKTKGLEMEAYGAMYAASVAPSPPPISLVVKSVCDFADGNKNDEFQAYSAYVASEFVKQLLPDLTKAIA